MSLTGDPDATGPDPSDPQANDEPAPDDAAGYRELQRLLFGDEKERLQELTRRIENLDVRAEDVAEALPDAVIRATRQNDRLGAALAPTVEESLQVSIRRNPKALVEAISPIMGPAIRRSILQAINGMVQTLNEAMEQSFSPKGLKWRIEAWRTGRSFGEVVALNTLLFQVEQVFLIHKETGLLLRHRSVRKSTDPDLVGSMLVAIRDFVGDSFEESGGGGTLDAVRVGDRTVWVEGGRDAVLATVVQGRAPESLRDTMTETLENIEVAYGEELRAFEGDDAPFAELDHELAECLVSQVRREEGADAGEEKRRSPVVAAAWVTVAVVLLFWIGLSIRDNRRWGRFVTALDAEAGIVVVSTGQEDGRRVVRGLRDRLAADPGPILLATALDTADVSLSFEPYESLDPDMVALRAVEALAPPEGIVLRMEGSRLIASGNPSAAWFARAQERATLLSGVASMALEGEAAELLALDEAASALRQLVLRFIPGRANVRAGPELTGMRTHLAQADSLAGIVGRPVVVFVTGSADAATGSPELNQALARSRAEALLRVLPASAYGNLDFRIRSEVVPEEGAPVSEDEARSVVLTLDPRAR